MLRFGSFFENKRLWLDVTSDYEECDLLGCNTMSLRQSPTFRKKIYRIHFQGWSVSKVRHQQKQMTKSTWLILRSWRWKYFWTIWRYKPGDSNLHSDGCESYKSNRFHTRYQKCKKKKEKLQCAISHLWLLVISALELSKLCFLRSYFMSLSFIKVSCLWIQYRPSYIVFYVVFIFLVPIETVLCYYLIKRCWIQSTFQWSEHSVITS
jgi:hypothetical protein